MKKSSLLFLAFLLSVFAFGQVESAESSKTKIDIYYFHRTDRCATCMSIEENTMSTLDTYFANEVKEGVINFRSINFEGDADTDLIEKYKADGPSLFLTKTKKGKENTKNMTDFALENSLHNAKKFNKGLRDNLNKMLR